METHERAVVSLVLSRLPTKVVSLGVVCPFRRRTAGNRKGSSLFDFHEFLMYRCGIRCKKWFRENALRYYAKHREEIPLGRFLRRQAILSLYRHRKNQASFIFFSFFFSYGVTKINFFENDVYQNLDFSISSLKRHRPFSYLVCFPQFSPEFLMNTHRSQRTSLQWDVHDTSLHIFKERITGSIRGI